LFCGPEDGVPVLFLHGNVSSATWWEEVMVTLPAGYRGLAPDQRGFGEADPAKKIDATRGMGDLADDAVALLDQLGLEQAHIVGNSLGGAVVWRLLMEAPTRFLSATLVAPGSPYGFGGTKDIEGTPCYDDFAGSGGGLSNPELLKRLAEGDRSLDSLFSPRSALRMLVFKPPFIPEREEEILSAMLSLHLGKQDLPGDFVQSPNWPHVAPGQWGATNALSPKYAIDPNQLAAATPKVNVLWIRGSHDLAVSNNAASDPATVGAAGLLPGWPGPAIYPPQPMLDQTRAVLEKYAAAGGAYQEVVIQDTGHAPFIEKLDVFNLSFHRQLAG
jgi:pimeloyl-ACP methyl ester carboxylesterase